MFDGSVLIDVAVNEPSDTIVMNSIELEIDALVVSQAGTTVDATFGLDDELERLTINLATPLNPETATIEIAFRGVLNDKLRGFYRSTYKDDSGVEHTLATTQFESTNARRCFPCWDEPAFKAIFEAHLEVPSDLLAISAMAETGRSEIDSGLVRIDFAPTPPMSTYLLAFVVGNLEATEPVDVDGVPVRIVHRPGHGHETGFALDATVFCLRWLTDYFGRPYLGDKIDMVAIPDFAFGAMENTGCVTFREVLLLVDPDTTTQPEQQRSVAVIAHELAHMWFGNLVTMAWWEGLWLKEAFATFMEISTTDAYRPDWKAWESFALERSGAFAVDALHSSRPIEFEVQTPADAEAMYDVLTYEKGAAVVRMLEQYVGADDFRTGIRNYMRDHAFANTVTDDLWRSIAGATSLPIEEMMRDWIYHQGFPLITARLDNDQVELDQRAFRLAPGDAAGEWNVPVTVTSTAGDTTLLMSPQGRVALDDSAATVVVDPESHGFFRTRYDDQLGQRLADNLMTLTAAQRYRLFDDTFSMVLAGQQPIGDFVRLAQALGDERSLPTWTTVVSGFSTLAHAAPDRAAAANVGRVFADIAAPQLERLGYTIADGETDQLTNEVRSTLFRSLGRLHNDPALNERARAIFADPQAETVNASMATGALQIITSGSDANDFDEVWRRYRSASSVQAERRYLFSLVNFDSSELIARVCDATLDGSIRSQEAAFVLARGLGNRWHGSQVWQFVTERWDAITALVPDNAVGRMLAGVQWLEHGDVADVTDFLAAHPIPQAGKAIDQHLERLQVHVALSGRFVAEWAEVTTG